MRCEAGKQEEVKLTGFDAACGDEPIHPCRPEQTNRLMLVDRTTFAPLCEAWCSP